MFIRSYADNMPFELPLPKILRIIAPFVLISRFYKKEFRIISFAITRCAHFIVSSIKSAICEHDLLLFW